MNVARGEGWLTAVNRRPGRGRAPRASDLVLEGADELADLGEAEAHPLLGRALALVEAVAVEPVCKVREVLGEVAPADVLEEFVVRRVGPGARLGGPAVLLHRVV